MLLVPSPPPAALSPAEARNEARPIRMGEKSMATAPVHALAGWLGLTPTRRAIVGGGLAALAGLGGRQEVRAARCSQATPCPACHRCHRRRCHPLRDGAACDGGTCVGAVCAPPKTTTRAA
jgi:hypothetical protein